MSLVEAESGFGKQLSKSKSTSSLLWVSTSSGISKAREGERLSVRWETVGGVPEFPRLRCIMVHRAREAINRNFKIWSSTIINLHRGNKGILLPRITRFFGQIGISLVFTEMVPDTTLRGSSERTTGALIGQVSDRTVRRREI